MVIVEYSPEWRGNLIEEEHPKEQENDRTCDIPSSSVANLETPAPHRKRRRSNDEIKDEIKASPQVRWKRTRSVAVAEAAREKWATLEAQIEFPILRPKTIDTP